MTYKTADNQPVPEPMLRQIHRYSFYKSSEGRQVSLVVLEIRQPTFMTLTLTEATDGYEVFAAEFLTGILSLRLAEGFRMVSASERHYTLVPAPVPGRRADGPATKAVCRDCGSNRIVRDACAHFDAQTGAWALLDVHQTDFCEDCNAEGDAIAQWVPADGAPAIACTPVKGARVRVVADGDYKDREGLVRAGGSPAGFFVDLDRLDEEDFPPTPLFTVDKLAVLALPEPPRVPPAPDGGAA